MNLGETYKNMTNARTGTVWNFYLAETCENRLTLMVNLNPTGFEFTTFSFLLKWM